MTAEEPTGELRLLSKLSKPAVYRTMLVQILHIDRRSIVNHFLYRGELARGHKIPLPPSVKSTGAKEFYFNDSGHLRAALEQ